MLDLLKRIESDISIQSKTYRVAFLYYEAKQIRFRKKADFLFVLFISHYSLFIIHFLQADFEESRRMKSLRADKLTNFHFGDIIELNERQVMK